MFRYIDLSSVDKGVIKCTDQYIAFKDAPCRARRIIHKNDIIMSTVRPNLQGFAFIDFDPVDVICSTGFAVLTAKQQMCNKYIYQLLYSKEIETQINNMLVGSNYPAINSSDVASLKICIPPFAEQKKIAEILGTWDRAIEELTGLIAEKKELKRGLMQKLLTGTQRLPGFTKPWKSKKIGDITRITTAGSKSQYIKETGSYLIVDMGAVSNEAALIAKKQTDYEGDFLVCDDLIMPKDDIGGGNIIGKTVVIDCDNKYILGDHVFKIRVTGEHDAKFISSLINSFEVNKYMRRVSTGSAQLGLAKRDVEKCMLFMPVDLAEQKAIADVLAKAGTEIDLLNQQLDVLKEQKRGLMQKLLTGEIRVKVDNE